MKDETFYAIGCFSLGVMIIFCILISPGCKNGIPPIEVSFWAGDSKSEGITRSQDKKTVQCKDPAFDEFVCLTYQDVEKIYKTMLRCKQWSTEEIITEEDDDLSDDPVRI